MSATTALHKSVPAPQCAATTDNDPATSLASSVPPSTDLTTSLAWSVLSSQSCAAPSTRRCSSSLSISRAEATEEPELAVSRDAAAHLHPKLRYKARRRMLQAGATYVSCPLLKPTRVCMAKETAASREDSGLFSSPAADTRLFNSPVTPVTGTRLFNSPISPVTGTRLFNSPVTPATGTRLFNSPVTPVTGTRFQPYKRRESKTERQNKSATAQALIWRPCASSPGNTDSSRTPLYSSQFTSSCSSLSCSNLVSCVASKVSSSVASSVADANNNNTCADALRLQPLALSSLSRLSSAFSCNDIAASVSSATAAKSATLDFLQRSPMNNSVSCGNVTASSAPRFSSLSCSDISGSVRRAESQRELLRVFRSITRPRATTSICDASNGQKGTLLANVLKEQESVLV